jgi:hypothetical protein
MSLEQWERDLRKQLGNLTTPVVSQPTVKQDQTTLYLVLLLVLLAVGLYAYDNKEELTTYFRQERCELPTNCCPPPKEQIIIQPDMSAIRSMQENIEKLRLEQEKINKRIQWNTDHLTLLADIQQENFAAIKNGNNNFIFFNRDWTINQMPKFLELTPEDKEFLKKYIKS